MLFFVTGVRDGGINISSKRWFFEKKQTVRQAKRTSHQRRKKTQKVGRDSKHEIYWYTKKQRRNADTRLKWTSVRSDVKILSRYCPVSSPNTQHPMFSPKGKDPVVMNIMQSLYLDPLLPLFHPPLYLRTMKWLMRSVPEIVEIHINSSLELVQPTDILESNEWMNEWKCIMDG